VSPRDAGLLRLQRAIAEHKGYTELEVVCGALDGVIYPDEGPVVLPRWPWDRSAAFELVDEMEEAGLSWTAVRSRSGLYLFDLEGVAHASPRVPSLPEAISRVYAAWKGIEVEP
jgi:hypothetical protein